MECGDQINRGCWAMLSLIELVGGLCGYLIVFMSKVRCAGVINLACSVIGVDASRVTLTNSQVFVLAD